MERGRDCRIPAQTSCDKLPMLVGAPYLYARPPQMRALLTEVCIAALMSCAVCHAAVHDDVRSAYGSGDYSKAAAALEAYAQAGYTSASILLGILQCDGKGVPRDDNAAANRFFHAASTDNADASFLAGYMVYVGRGVPRDREMAKVFLLDAVNMGSADAGALLYNQHTPASFGDIETRQLHALGAEVSQSEIGRRAAADGAARKALQARREPTQGGAEIAGDVTSSIEIAKKQCADLGFKVNTEAFGRCVLQLSK